MLYSSEVFFFLDSTATYNEDETGMHSLKLPNWRRKCNVSGVPIANKKNEHLFEHSEEYYLLWQAMLATPSVYQYKHSLQHKVIQPQGSLSRQLITKLCDIDSHQWSAFNQLQMRRNLNLMIRLNEAKEKKSIMTR